MGLAGSTRTHPHASPLLEGEGFLLRQKLKLWRHRKPAPLPLCSLLNSYAAFAPQCTQNLAAVLTGLPQSAARALVFFAEHDRGFSHVDHVSVFEHLPAGDFLFVHKGAGTGSLVFDDVLAAFLEDRGVVLLNAAVLEQAERVQLLPADGHRCS